MPQRTVLIAILASALTATPAAAKPHAHHKPKHHCKQGYVRHVKIVKHHEHHRTVKARRVECVKIKHELVKHHAMPTPSPSAPATLTPTTVTKFHAHLDPSYTRDPSNPFKVTYAYSASATTEPAGGIALAATSEPVPLPEGVLQLYSDGKLACSKNVGGSTAGGECPVEYSSLGEHTIITVYTSSEGKGAATETQIERIEDINGSITLHVAYIPLQTPVLEPGETGCQWSNGEATSECKRWIIGHIEMSGSATTELGSPPPGTVNVNLGARACHWSTDTFGCGEGATRYTVWATTWSNQGSDALAEVGILANDETLPSVTEGSRCSSYYETSCAWLTIQQGHIDIKTLEEEGYHPQASYSGAGYAIPSVESTLTAKIVAP